MSARAFMAAGDLYYKEYNPTTGQWGELEGPYETDKFEIKPDAEVKDQISRGKTTDGQTIATVARGKPTTLAVSLTEITGETINKAIFGTHSTVSHGAATVTDRPIVAKLGKWVEVKSALGVVHKNFAEAGFTVENAAGTVTYVKGTDYLVNYALGMVKALPGGAITEGATVNVSGATLAFTSDFTKGSTKSQARLQFILDGTNLVDGKDCIVTVLEAVLKPDSAFDFMGSEFAKATMSGTLVTPAGYDAPYTVDVRTQVA